MPPMRSARASRALACLSLLAAGCRTGAPTASPEPPAPPPSLASVGPTPSAAAPALPPPPSAQPPAPRVGAAWTGTRYRLTASVHPQVPPHTFELRGTGRAVGARVHLSATVPRDIPDKDGLPCDPRCAQRELGPGTLEVTDAAGRTQSLTRGYPPLGHDAAVEPQALELSTRPVFGRNVGAGDLALADYDGDGYLDLEVLVGEIHDGRGRILRFKQVWLYAPRSGDFQELTALRGHELFLDAPGCLSSVSRRGGPTLTVYELQRRALVHVGTADTGYADTEPRRWYLERQGSRCVKLRPGDAVVGP